MAKTRRLAQHTVIGKNGGNRQLSLNALDNGEVILHLAGRKGATLDLETLRFLYSKSTVAALQQYVRKATKVQKKSISIIDALSKLSPKSAAQLAKFDYSEKNYPEADEILLSSAGGLEIPVPANMAENVEDVA